MLTDTGWHQLKQFLTMSHKKIKNKNNCIFNAQQHDKVPVSAPHSAFITGSAARAEAHPRSVPSDSSSKECSTVTASLKQSIAQ